MDDLTIDLALGLARMHGGHRVSLLMPTRPFVPGSPDENAIRLKTLLNRAGESLGERGLRHPEIEALLAPGRALTEDRPFWMRAEEGLALFLGPEGMHAFRLPRTLPELVRVNARYHLRPLLPFVDAHGHFWLLFISQKQVRLYEGTREEIHEVPTEHMPTSLAEALRWDDFERASLQFHSAAGPGRSQAPMYHGNKDPDWKNELARFFRQIDAALHDKFRGQTSPLVLAGVDYLIPLYRDVNTYPHLVYQAVLGNVDDLPLPELHRKTLEALHSLAERETEQFTRQIEETWGSSKTTPDPETIVPAAFVGRVDTLFLTDGGEWWGTFDEASGRATFHKRPGEDDEDLLDLAALRTLENGGAVVNLPPERMPRGEEAVAVLRY
jgi:hypothetical protein